jgi:hypothetical protein
MNSLLIPIKYNNNILEMIGFTKIIQKTNLFKKYLCDNDKWKSLLGIYIGTTFCVGAIDGGIQAFEKKNPNNITKIMEPMSYGVFYTFVGPALPFITIGYIVKKMKNKKIDRVDFVY